jgi:hypothetical protein
MLLQINSKYRITGGDYNNELQKVVISKDGAKSWKTIGFYPQLEQALIRLIDDEIIASDSEGAYLLSEIRQIKDEIIKAIK